MKITKMQMWKGQDPTGWNLLRALESMGKDVDGKTIPWSWHGDQILIQREEGKFLLCEVKQLIEVED